MLAHVRSRTLALLGILAGVACGDGANNNPTGPTPSAGMSAAVDGQGWTAVSATAVRSGTVIAIGGSDIGGQLGIGLGLIEAGTGDYPINATSASNANVTSGTQTWIANASSGSGTITITTLTTTRIAGTFSFTAPVVIGNPTPATRVVTNGTFDLTF